MAAGVLVIFYEEPAFISVGIKLEKIHEVYLHMYYNHVKVACVMLLTYLRPHVKCLIKKFNEKTFGANIGFFIENFYIQYPQEY